MQFETSRGLRQGDSLSPLLFLLVTETLGAMLCKAKDARLIKGFSMGREEISVSHLQYADDNKLILSGNSQIPICLLRCVLRCFEAIIGLCMNLDKSLMVGVGDVQNIGALATDLGCKVGFLPISYLGLPLGVSYKSKEVWGPMVDRVRRKLAGWKAVSLTKGGRITLLKAVVASILVYFMSLFVMPSSIANPIERLQRDFL